MPASDFPRVLRLAAALLLFPVSFAGSAEPPEFAAMKALARELAAQEYTPRESSLAPFWRDLSYAEHRQIRFRRDRALWADSGSPVALEFFHPGWVFPHPLTFRSVVQGVSEPILWEADRFDYGGLEIPPDTPWPDGFAGYRILAPVDGPGRLDELAVFLGGTYFRARAPGLSLGTSARALAIDPHRPDSPVVPAFEHWWVERPEDNAREFRAWALMDCAAATGAWQFRIQPGRATVMEIDAEVIFRQPVEMPGLLTFSSMHWFSEFTRGAPDDFRPEVHDADGLLIHLHEDEAIWRPLDPSRVTRHSVFSVGKFHGFGLAQRDREFSHYQDLQAAFETRPSVWLEPVGHWPAGEIHLIERPAGDDSFDNVTCFWKPAEPVQPGQPVTFSCRMQWLADIAVPGMARVVSSRRTVLPGSREEGREQHPGELFVIDFSPLPNPADDAGKPELLVEVESEASLAEKKVERNPHTGGWRATFRLRIRDETESMEIACRLLRGGRPVSEKWSALWKRD